MFNISSGAMAKTSTHLQDKEVNQVYKTKDYSKFKSKEGNRNLNELHLKRLTESIKENDLLHANPILVNEKYEIIDGQHRFNVCRQLGKTVHYMKVKSLGLSDIQMLNANSKNWKLQDYIDGYCSMGMSEYCYLKNLLKTTGLGITHLIAIFAYGGMSGTAQHDLRRGELKLTNKNRGLIILQWLNDWEKVYTGARRRTFVLSILRLYETNGYSHKKMMQKMKYQSAKLVDCTNTKTYLALLEEIYNFKERGEKLRFF